MYVSKNYWSYGVTAALAVWALWACGPDFGLSVLSARKDAVLAAPSFSFYRQLETLVPPPLPPRAYAGEYHTGVQILQQEGQMLVTEAPGQPKTYRLNEELPTAVRLYVLGLQAISEGKLGIARQHAQSILSLPENQRHSRELAALFLLGRVALWEEDYPAAAKQFAAVRAAWQRGMSDPLSVTVESFGEEALIYWQQRDIAPAVRLYAQQAAMGSERGRSSLLRVANTVIDDEKLLHRGMRDPLTRRLLLIYLNARNSKPRLARVLAALERQQITDAPDAGLVAAAAYDLGEFAMAGRFAARQPGSAAAWVRAKLALRAGDVPTALAGYSQALEAARRGAGDHPRGDALAAELSLARLGRGEYLQALELMVEAANREWIGPFGNYWVDAAYLAERMLTVDELQKYVDRAVPATRYVPKHEYDSPPLSWQLRALLGRRLMREGRRAEAVRYFEDAKVRGAAEEYRAALARAESAWRPQVWKAEAWLDAARLARYHGLELLGFELAPDYAAFYGNYQWPAEETLKAELASAGEAQRFRATALKEPVRFHYRVTAVGHALQAAALVPAKSKGFAATLCEATRWVIASHPATAKAVYQRYLKEGAWVPWAERFPSGCPVTHLESETAWQARMALRRVSRRAGFDVIPVAGLAVASAFTWVLLRWLYRPSAL